MGRGSTAAEAAAPFRDMKPPRTASLKTQGGLRYCLNFSSNCAKRFVLDVKREDV